MRTPDDNYLLPKPFAFITFRSAGAYKMTYLSNTYLCAKWHISKNYKLILFMLLYFHMEIELVLGVHPASAKKPLRHLIQPLHPLHPIPVIEKDQLV
jgi:hypothetical protein